jgi:phosphoribosyl 1,2-cyclic phosphate phosphodiesterase
MTRSLTILGCGSSGGVPRIGGDWGVCDPSNPKNRRRRCSIMLEQTGAAGVTRVVIDTSPDFREQMLAAEVTEIDGVWYTHEHADHTHGIDELRAFFLRQRRCVPLWADHATLTMLENRFTYCFLSAPDSDYPPIVKAQVIVPDAAFATPGAGGDIVGRPFVVRHGNIQALGFRVGDMAYTPDLNGVPEASAPYLEGLSLWVVDALRRQHHPSHFSLGDTLAAIARFKPGRAVITNLHIDMDYDALRAELPPGVEPAYDGLRLALS